MTAVAKNRLSLSRLIVLTVVQAAYLVVSALYLAAHGWPAIGEGKVNPYVAHFAIQVISFPTVVLAIPLMFTTFVLRRRITSKSRAELVEVWRNVLIMIPVSALAWKGLLEGTIGRVTFRSEEPIWLLVGEGLLYLVLADFWFYVSHRALHSRLLYRFHVDHHVHRAPTEALAFFALSPTEAFVSGFLTVFLPTLVVPLHVIALGVANFVILLFGLYIHESALVSALPFGVNGPAVHQHHHRHGRRNKNFSLLFTVFDHLFKTWAPAD
jgi:sterol desaturase/sphingolipid hydroxylase (fatty acid hydroxylase superfamily)